MEMSERIAEKWKKRAAHGGKMQRLKVFLTILHNELAVAVYLYCRDLLLFQFLRITENSVKWRMSVSQEMVKNCAYQMHNALTERKTLKLTFRGRKTGTVEK